MKEYVVIEGDRVVARYTDQDLRDGRDLMDALAIDPRLATAVVMSVAMVRIFTMLRARRYVIDNRGDGDE